MYYQPEFLEKKWAEYKDSREFANDDDVDPDDFAVWGFEQLLHHRIPIYQTIAKNFGYQVHMEEIPKIKSEDDFLNLLGAIDRQALIAMPIKIPNDLPARLTLEKEGVMLMTEDTAHRQDIRALRIGLLNLMPNKIRTETQFARLIGATPLQVELSLIKITKHTPKNTPNDHMIAFYRDWEKVRKEKFDGLIITGRADRAA